MARAHVSSLVAVAALFLAGASGCSSAPPPPAKTADAASSTRTGSTSVTQGPRNDTATPTSGSIHIEDRILKACGDIPEAHFAFDSAAIEPAAEASLSALARCFVSGALKGKGMKLEGHADPRGTDSLNMGLGQQRAGSVAKYIAGKGMDAAKIATTSVGSSEATGTDEAGWAKDRKVEVFLAD